MNKSFKQNHQGWRYHQARDLGSGVFWLCVWLQVSKYKRGKKGNHRIVQR